ncbi:MAG: MBL fold metallo-hydrolase [Brevinematia bacterium]
MKISTFVLGDIFVNTYVVSNGKKAFIIDPASSDSSFLDEISEFEIEYIINTHGHFDHIEGNSLVKERYNSKIIIHEMDAALLTNSFLNLSIFMGKKVISPPADIVLKGRENNICLCGINFRILNMPGHSKGSIILINEDEKVLFAGDLIFENSYGRVDFPGSSSEEMSHSLELIKQFPDDYTVYPGHGNTFCLKEFKRWSEGIIL